MYSGSSSPPATNRWATLVVVCLAQFMVILDATIVNVALPSIQRSLHFSSADLQWVINSYTLMFGGFLTDLLSWEWCFFVNVPVGIAAIVAALRYVPNTLAEHKPQSIDVAGAASVTSGLVVLVYAIVKAQAWGFGSGRTLGLAAVAAVLLGAFV